MIYYVFALFASFFAYLAVHARSKVVLFFSFLMYFIPASIRYGIGQDYFYTYVPMFNWIRQNAISIYTNNIIEYSEFGFNALNRLIGYFTTEPQWLFVITSAICLILAYKCIWDYSIDITMSVFFLVLGSYYIGSYSLIRQSIGIVVFIYSLRYIEQKRIVSYLLCMMVAFSVHTFSIVYVPFYFIANFKFTKKQYYIITTLSIILLNIFSSVVIHLVSMTRFANRINFSSKYNILLSFVVIVVFFVAVFGMDNETKNQRYRMFLNIHFVATCLIGLSAFLDTTDRVIFSYYYANFITIPYFIKTAKWGKYRQIIILGIFLSMAVLWGYEHLYYDQFRVLPYQSIFSR